MHHRLIFSRRRFMGSALSGATLGIGNHAWTRTVGWIKARDGLVG